MPDLAPAGSSEGLPRKEFAYLRMHTKERQKEINRPVRAHRRATGMRRRPQRVEAAYRARLVRRGPETLRDMVVLLPLALSAIIFFSLYYVLVLIFMSSSHQWHDPNGSAAAEGQFPATRAALEGFAVC